MTYKYNIKSNLKLLFPYVLVGIMLIFAISSFFFFEPLMAIIFTAIALWFSFRICKTMKNILSSRVESYTEGFTVFMADGSKLDFEYKLITHAGFITNTGFIFAYEESLDRIVQLPPAFIGFEDFINELKENLSCYKDYTLEEGQTIIDWLKAELGITEDTEEPVEDNEQDLESTDSNNNEEE